jgi:hypothetical protein
MSLPKYFIGACDVRAALLNATTGLPAAFVDMGEAPVVEWDQQVEYADNYKTSRNAPNMQDAHVPIKRTGSLMIQIKEQTAANLEQLLYSASTAPAAGSYTGNEAFPSGIQAGESYLLPARHVGITNLVLKDALAASLTLNTHFTYDANTGLVTFVNLGSFTQPFKAFSYGYALSTILKLLSATPPELGIMVDGVNLMVPGERFRAIFDRIQFDAASKISLKAGSATGTGNTAQEYELKGPALIGVGKTLADGFGEYRVY